MLGPVFHITPLTSIVRERKLPVSGSVKVNNGQKVNPTDVVAEGNFAREHILLDIAMMLGVSRKAADKLIKVREGDRLKEGGFIADGRGLFRRAITAPSAGRVIIAGGGQVLMEAGDGRIELRAGLPGVVVKVIPERGVVIRTAGSLIQGVWGNGRIDNGLMTSLIEKPDDLLVPERLDVSLRGSVILGGHIHDEETLHAAAEMPVRGLIVPSIHPSLIHVAASMKYPILVLDGVGTMPMNSAAFKLLTTNNKREVTVNAERYDRYAGNRPEAIIPLPVTSEPEESPDFKPFAVGQIVRMRRSPHAGMMGTIAGLPAGVSKLPNGLMTPAAYIRLENSANVLVPLVNLEVVG